MKVKIYERFIEILEYSTIQLKYFRISLCRSYIFGTKDYKVNNLKVIYETDWKPLEEDGTNKLTLITCIADKRNQRLCVQAIAD